MKECIDGSCEEFHVNTCCNQVRTESSGCDGGRGRCAACQTGGQPHGSSSSEHVASDSRKLRVGGISRQTEFVREVISTDEDAIESGESKDLVEMIERAARFDLDDDDGRALCAVKIAVDIPQVSRGTTWTEATAANRGIVSESDRVLSLISVLDARDDDPCSPVVQGSHDRGGVNCRYPDEERDSGSVGDDLGHQGSACGNRAMFGIQDAEVEPGQCNDLSHHRVTRRQPCSKEAGVTAKGRFEVGPFQVLVHRFSAHLGQVALRISCW